MFCIQELSSPTISPEAEQVYRTALNELQSLELAETGTGKAQPTSPTELVPSVTVTTSLEDLTGKITGLSNGPVAWGAATTAWVGSLYGKPVCIQNYIQPFMLPKDDMESISVSP